MLEYVLIGKFATESGHSEDAIRKKIDRGEWLEGKVWIRRGGRIYIIVEGYYRWVEEALQESVPPRIQRSKSTSGIVASAAASG